MKDLRGIGKKDWGMSGDRGEQRLWKGGVWKSILYIPKGVLMAESFGEGDTGFFRWEEGGL